MTKARGGARICPSQAVCPLNFAPQKKVKKRTWHHMTVSAAGLWPSGAKVQVWVDCGTEQTRQGGQTGLLGCWVEENEAAVRFAFTSFFFFLPFSTPLQLLLPLTHCLQHTRTRSSCPSSLLELSSITFPPSLYSRTNLPKNKAPWACSQSKLPLALKLVTAAPFHPFLSLEGTCPSVSVS